MVSYISTLSYATYYFIDWFMRFLQLTSLGLKLFIPFCFEFFLVVPHLIVSIECCSIMVYLLNIMWCSKVLSIVCYLAYIIFYHLIFWNSQISCNTFISRCDIWFWSPFTLTQRNSCNWVWPVKIELLLRSENWSEILQEYTLNFYMNSELKALSKGLNTRFWVDDMFHAPR